MPYLTYLRLTRANWKTPVVEQGLMPELRKLELDFEEGALNQSFQAFTELTKLTLDFGEGDDSLPAPHLSFPQSLR